ncbi:MAG: chaperone modulator CbpM [Saonia sp.]
MYITLKDFCIHYHIEESFVLNLSEYELIQLRKINGRYHLYSEELPKLEKIIRFHHELNINVEGIQAIEHLLQRVAELQEELKILKRKLGRLEKH